MYLDFQKSPSYFGFNSSTWTAALFGEHINRRYEIVYKKSALYVLIHQMGFSFQRCRSYYPERNEDACKVAKVDIKNFRSVQKR